jgi:hypothetical protein
LNETLQFISGKAGKWYDSQVVDACHSLFKSGYRIDKIDMDALTWISSLSE